MENNIKNRRPIRSRETRWANWLAKFLAKKGATPNGISLMSILFACLAGSAFYCMPFYKENYWLFLLFLFLAILGIQLRLICNLIDGMVAIEGGLKSAVGPVYNELPDRISDIVLFLSLAYSLNSFEFSVSAGWAASLFSVMTAYIRLLGGTCGLEQKFLGPMAKQQRMAILTIGCILSIFLPKLSEWIFFICLLIIAIGAFFTTIRRTKLILSELNLQNNYKN